MTRTPGFDKLRVRPSLSARTSGRFAGLGRGLAVVLVGACSLLGPGCRAPQIPEAESLVGMFQYADVLGEKPVIDIGSPDARWHLVEGWSTDEKSSGRSFAWALGQRSTLRFFVARPRDLNLTFSGWCPEHLAEPQEVRVAVNGQPVGSFVLNPKNQEEPEVSVPSSVLVAGENSLELGYSCWVQPVTSDPETKDDRPLAAAWDEIRFAGAAPGRLPRVDLQEAGHALILPLDSRVDYYVKLSTGQELVSEQVWLERAEQALLVVSVELASGARSEHELELSSSAGVTLNLPIAVAAAEPARVSLHARSVEPADAGEIYLRRPALVQSEAGTEAPARATNHQLVAQQTPNVIVYMIDSLRADHLGCYGYPRPTSPHIDAFAQESVLFEQCLAQASWTRPSVASVMTGVFPQVHGAIRSNSILHEDQVTLTEQLEQAGYETRAVVTNFIVSEKFGFGQGFHLFTYLNEKERPKRYRLELHQMSDRVNEIVFDWLETAPPEQPFFYYIHTTDPHAPYTPREPYSSRLAGEVQDSSVGSWASVKALERSLTPVDEQTRQDMIALYDGEIAFNDASFGALVDRLKQLGLYDSTMIILLSDHGEEFHDHGRWEHSFSLYQELLEVPLVIKLPNQLHAGTRVGGVVRHVDLLPTILEYLQIPFPAALQGVSMLPRVAEPAHAVPELTSFAHLVGTSRQAIAMLRGSTKVISYDGFDRSRAHIELFHLDSDPAERQNLAQSRPVSAGYYNALLRATEREWESGHHATIELDGETKQQLQALGYLQ